LLGFLDHTQLKLTRTCTRGRTPLNEWSASRRGRYLHYLHNTQTQENNIRALVRIRTRNPSNQRPET